MAKSTEVSSALMLLFSFAMIAFYGPYMFVTLRDYMKWTYTPEVLVRLSSLTQTNVANYMIDMIVFSIRVVAPVGAVLMIVGLATNIMQVGFQASTYPIKPNLSKINPLTGFKRIFSLRSLTELLKSLVKVGTVGYVGWKTIIDELPHFVQMSAMEIPDATAMFASTMMRLVFKIILVLLVLALLDYMYQKFEFEKSIKMSKQEIKDEYKQREGDPLIRRRIRERQREMAMRRMMASVPHADVIITNPVHLAVALQYVAEEMHAPKVVAKGGGVVAERIKQIARDNKVPIVENRALAQSLFKMADVGDFVPPQLFKAVAEILAYVYKIGRKDHSFGLK